MRNGQKRMRGRGGHRKSQNPLTRVYESNGPDVKIRGTASHIAEKYIQLARDAQSSGDPVAAENYYQHAEHYFRLIAAAQEQLRQQNPYYAQQQQGSPQGAADDFDEGDDDSQPTFMGQNEPSYAPQQQLPGGQSGDDLLDEDGEDAQPFMGQNEPSFVPREGQAQPYLPPNAQPFPPRDQAQYNRPQQQPQGGQDVGGLPAFITGGSQQQPSASGNGHDQGDRGQDRFGGGYRRRRRHRGGGGFRQDRPDFGGNPQGAGASTPQGDGGGDEPHQSGE